MHTVLDNPQGGLHVYRECLCGLVLVPARKDGIELRRKKLQPWRASGTGLGELIIACDVSGITNTRNSKAKIAVTRELIASNHEVSNNAHPSVVIVTTSKETSSAMPGQKTSPTSCLIPPIHTVEAAASLPPRKVRKKL